MLRIGKLGPGAEDYYVREVAGPEAYYLGAGEAPGHWLGSALAELRLSRERCWEVDPSAALHADPLLTARHLAGIGSASRHPARIAEASCNAWSGPGCPVH